MIALIDATDPVQGSAPGGGAQTDARADVANTNHGDIVLGHLLNANLGGPGLAHNLYPISDVANREQLSTFEFHVKNRVMANLATPLAGGKEEHIEYQVTVEPTGGGAAGSGNGALGGITNPNATITSKFRERNGGATGWAWSNWEQKTIRSEAGDSMDAVAGGWGTAGAGSRMAPAVNNLQILGLPLPGGGGAPLTRAGGAVPVAPGWANNALIEGRVAGGAVGTFIGYIE